MNTLLKSLVSMFVAVVVALATSLIAYAVSGPFTQSESTLLYVQGSSQSPISVSNSGCQGGSCRYLYGTNNNPGTFRWNYTSANMYEIWAYDPTIGEAAARYWWRTYNGGVRDNWYITVNQANVNNKGKFVYLGFADYLPNTYGELRLSNGCLDPAYACGNKVYWDSMRYTTNP